MGSHTDRCSSGNIIKHPGERQCSPPPFKCTNISAFPRRPKHAGGASSWPRQWQLASRMAARFLRTTTSVWHLVLRRVNTATYRPGRVAAASSVLMKRSTLLNVEWHRHVCPPPQALRANPCKEWCRCVPTSCAKFIFVSTTRATSPRG